VRTDESRAKPARLETGTANPAGPKVRARQLLAPQMNSSTNPTVMIPRYTPETRSAGTAMRRLTITVTITASAMARGNGRPSFTMARPVV
jgi:hypothetical protein